MPRTRILLCLITLCSITSTTHAQQKRSVWTPEQANTWYGQQPWLVGCNFIPSTAINQLEMWQAATFDTATIDKELGWAEGLGMNSVRVFLHHLAYLNDPKGMIHRMNIFLQIASRHHIKPLFVLFDSCWDPNPQAGQQQTPRPRVHNSHWIQSPGAHDLKNKKGYPALEKYVKGIITPFANDNRILGWDLWNEADDNNAGNYDKEELPNKTAYVLPLLKKAFAWARAATPTQPLTACVWQPKGNWGNIDSLSAIEMVALTQSDIITFHCYRNGPEEMEKRIQWLQRYHKPVMCTEYMARTIGSTFEACLPLLKKYHTGAFNWGLVEGRTNTIYPWDSWRTTYTDEPPLWFHDIFRKDGTPYKEDEVKLIRELTAQQ